MKTISLVTGANRGIGLEICRQLLALDHHVLLGSRDEFRGEDAARSLRTDGADIDVVVIDLNDPKSFDDTVEWIDKKFGKLDVLINNAGGAEPVDWQSNATNVPVDTLRRTFEMNFFSLVDLTQRMLPLLRKSDSPRIVNQSSILGSLGEHSDPASTIAGVNALAYDASKTAVNAFTVHLSKVLRDEGFKVNSVHPGSVQTDLNPAGDLTVEDGAKTAVQLATIPDEGPTGGFFYFWNELAW